MSQQERKPPSVEQMCALAERLGPEKGWTDTPEYIRNHTAFLICGRWFLARPSGEVESME